MATYAGQSLLAFADYISVVPICLAGGGVWRKVDAFGFRILAENNFIWARGKGHSLSHCVLQGIAPDDALLLIERKRRASMVRGRLEVSTANKTTYLEEVQDRAPIHQHYLWNRWRPINRGRPDLAGPQFDEVLLTA